MSIYHNFLDHSPLDGYLSCFQFFGIKFLWTPMHKFFVFANTLFISLEKILGIRVAGNIYGFLGGSDGKESTCLVRDLGSVPRLGRFPGGRHGNPLKYSCLENPHGQRSLVGYSPRGCRELEIRVEFILLRLASLALCHLLFIILLFHQASILHSLIHHSTCLSTTEPNISGSASRTAHGFPPLSAALSVTTYLPAK